VSTRRSFNAICPTTVFPVSVVLNQMQMRNLISLFLLPGDLLLGLTNIKGDDHRGLVRMLANSLIWTLVGILVVVFIV
jgi:hypothetical protein